MISPENSSPVQQTDGPTPSQQQQAQQAEGDPQQQQPQQGSKTVINLSEMRYDLGPELKQVKGAPP